MNKLEAKQKMIALFDDVAKGVATLIISAVVSRVVDNAYDNFIVARRKPTVEDGNA